MSFESGYIQDKTPTLGEVKNNISENNEYSSVNIERTADFCEVNFNSNENLTEVCNSLNNNILAGLGNSGIDGKLLFEKNNIKIA